jgi:hypothetical protein
MLCVTVTLKNEGDLNLEVTFDDSALTVGRIVQDKHHGQTIQALHRSCHWYLPGGGRTGEQLSDPRIFRTGQTRQIPFALEIADPGIYLVQFQAVYQKRPFDDEHAFRKKPLAIIAFEQKIHVVSGTPG